MPEDTISDVNKKAKGIMPCTKADPSDVFTSTAYAAIKREYAKMGYEPTNGYSHEEAVERGLLPAYTGEDPMREMPMDEEAAIVVKKSSTRFDTHLIVEDEPVLTDEQLKFVQKDRAKLPRECDDLILPSFKRESMYLPIVTDERLAKAQPSIILV